ncbi:MAG: NADH-quinone oxidoreductase subunit NuoK, partial [Spirochaetota bacterium]|nr:NADH-quinone oxidoreductase subunit NuoK [Spirochaetota bacterium]
MTLFTLNNAIILGLILFCIGVYGVLTRRNLLVVLMSLEIMFNAVNFIFLAFNYFKYYQQGKELGHYFVILVIAVAAAEAAVGLAILVT